MNLRPNSFMVNFFFTKLWISRGNVLEDSASEKTIIIDLIFCQVVIFGKITSKQLAKMIHLGMKSDGKLNLELLKEVRDAKYDGFAKGYDDAQAKYIEEQNNMTSLNLELESQLANLRLKYRDLQDTNRDLTKAIKTIQNLDVVKETTSQ